MLAPITLALTLVSGPKFDFYSFGPYEGGVPKPESILGYNPGDRHTVFRDIERVGLEIAAKASKRVKVFEFGKSWEGRPLRIYAISSPENIARLEQFRQDNLKLVNPTDPAACAKIVEKNPTFVWVNEGIHGDETASFESGMWLLYTLAASNNPAIKFALDNAVILLNPAYNPDGHERYVVWYNSVAYGSPKDFSFEMAVPDVARGRANHYRFDMNRDRISMSQIETQSETREYQRWFPQVYADQHGQVSTYFFPPTAMAVNPNVDRKRYNDWCDIFGRATAKAFDEHGWMYFIRQDFDFYAPCYLDTWTGLSGAIGMTHETDGGRTVGGEREDGTELTLRNGMEKHFTSALAVIRSAGENRKALLASFLDFKTKAISGKHAGKFQRVVAVSEDPRPLRRLKALLAKSGIKSAFAEASFTQPDAHDYWSDKVGEQTFPSGSLVIDMAQSQGPMAKSLFEIESGFEPEFIQKAIAAFAASKKPEKIPAPEFPGFYDLTGWSLIYGHDLKGWWCESAPKIELTEEVREAKALTPEKSDIGYVLPYRDRDDILAVFDLLQKGYRGRVVEKPIETGGAKVERGAFMFLASRNDDNLRSAILDVSNKRGVSFWPLTSAYPDNGSINSPGSDATRALAKPKIGAVFGNEEWMASFGGFWYLMDREFQLPFTPLAAGSFESRLNDFSCIVFPGGGNYGSPSAKLKDWVREGGCVVLLGSVNWAMGGEGGFFNLESARMEGDTGMGYLPGSLFRAEIDTRLFLGFGYGTATDKRQIAVPIDGSRFLKAKTDGSTVVALGGPDLKKTLTGWSWPDDTEKRVANTAWAHVQRFGRGSVVAFTQDPAERALFPGLYKMLLNAMLFGARPN